MAACGHIRPFLTGLDGLGTGIWESTSSGRVAGGARAALGSQTLRLWIPALPPTAVCPAASQVTSLPQFLTCEMGLLVPTQRAAVRIESVPTNYAQGGVLGTEGSPR